MSLQFLVTCWMSTVDGSQKVGLFSRFWDFGTNVCNANQNTLKNYLHLHFQWEKMSIVWKFGHSVFLFGMSESARWILFFCSWILQSHTVCDFVGWLMYDLVISCFCSCKSVRAVGIISHVWFGSTEGDCCWVSAPQAMCLNLGSVSLFIPVLRLVSTL